MYAENVRILHVSALSRSGIWGRYVFSLLTQYFGDKFLAFCHAAPSEMWDGPRTGVQKAAAVFGADKV